MASFYKLTQQINWQAPWYQTLTVPTIMYDCASVYAWLNHQTIQNPILTYQGLAIQFVSQSALPDNTAYESFIGDTGNICTRDNLHDLLNGLIWLNFPKTKAVLNYLHTHDIAHNGITAHRSPLRNALTLFDENGGVVVSSDVKILIQLQAFDWQNALFSNRKKWQSPNQRVQFFPFGHALLEKLVTPRKNITSHVLLLNVSQDFFTLTITEQRVKLDGILAKSFLANYQEILQSKNFQPLPVMGIPNFCAENKEREFYQDKDVFREAKDKKSLLLQIKNEF